MLKRNLMETDPSLLQATTDIATSIIMLNTDCHGMSELIGDLSRDALGIDPRIDVADIDPSDAERLFFVMRGVNQVLHPKPAEPKLGTSADQAYNMTANVPQPPSIGFVATDILR